MLIKKILVLTVIFTCLVAASAVSAADNVTGDVVSADVTDEISIVENQQLEQDNTKELNGVSDDGTFTALQNRIDNAEEGSTVTLENDYLYNEDFNNTGGIKISKSLTIDGKGYTIDANKKSRIFNVTANNVTLKDITFLNGDNNRKGGAVYFSGSTGNVMECNFINNTAVVDGGAVCFDSDSTGLVSNCNFTKNKVTELYGSGGAICFTGDATANVTACSFTDNYAGNKGGALYFFNNAHVTDCNFINNAAYFDGGAILMGDGSVENCNFINNKGDGWGCMGGAIYIVSHSIANVMNCNFINCTAADGGAVYFDESSSGEIIGCNFTNNRATNYSGLGGALFVFDSADVVSCNFINNSATNGGAIDITSGSVTACNFTDNKANNSGGAIWVVLDSNINISDSVFNNNSAVKSGGALYFDDALSNAKINSTFINNSANNGGAIYFNAEINNVTINGCFKDNGAVRAGGAIFTRGQSRSNNFSAEFYGNRAGQASGGAIFFYNLVENNIFESIFMENYALYGGAIFFYNKANSNKFNSDFINNTAKSCGGAMFFHNTTNGNNFSGCFIDNHALGEVDESVGNGGAITFKDTSSNSIFTCDFINNTAALNGGGVNYRHTPYNITFNSNFINNTSPSGGGVNFFEIFENVIFNGEFIGNSATNGGAIVAGSGIIKDVLFKNNRAEKGGAVYFAESAGEIVNCNFINNSVSSMGGAVYFYGEGNVMNCSFINNNAAGNDSCGGAVYLNNVSNVVNCNFTNNAALLHGGAVDIFSGSVLNCNFINNSVSSMGGAVYFYGEGNVMNCSFINNNATGNDSCGGAVYFNENGTMENCNFTANTAISDGGAVCFDDNSTGEAINCNFTKNKSIGEDSSGGAICFYNNATVTDCNFVNNFADDGGAINMDSGCVNNCNFVNNTASNSGGAVYFYYEGNMMNCNFTNNNATYCGGAVYTDDKITVINCNFNGNEANGGSALFLWHGETAKFYIISHSTFFNNKANVKYEPFESTMNGNNLEITFMGNDNILNAIYSRSDEVNVTNVTYWGANGIENTGASTIKLSKSSNESGQNITVFGVVNGKAVNTTKVTDADGKIVLEDVGDYMVIVRHSDDSYYGDAEKVFTNMQSQNVTHDKIDTILTVDAKFSRVANDFNAGERGDYFYAVLTDVNGNRLANKTVQVAVNGPIYNVTTDDKGQAGVKVNLANANIYTYALAFQGDDEFNAAPLASSKLTLTAKKTSITASAKTFKKSAKTKSYSVTLKTSKNPYDGKTYLSAGKKITISVNGKTFTAKTNAKGVAKFNIKLTKKGTFTAKIKFAGDKTYKASSKNVKITIK